MSLRYQKLEKDKLVKVPTTSKENPVKLSNTGNLVSTTAANTSSVINATLTSGTTTLDGSGYYLSTGTGFNVPNYTTWPTTVTTTYITPRTDPYTNFNRWAIGFYQLLETFAFVDAEAKLTSYPPYNVHCIDGGWYIEMAVAGFGKEDLKVFLKGYVLNVVGKIEDKEDAAVYKGIATRNFKHKFVLANGVVIKSAKLQAGLLRITMEQKLPDEKKAKIIPIV